MFSLEFLLVLSILLLQIIGTWVPIAQPSFVQGQSSGLAQQPISSGVVQPIEPGITKGVSPYTRILASNARDDEVDKLGQVWPNFDCTNDLVADYIAILVQSDLVVEPQDHGDPSLR